MTAMPRPVAMPISRIRTSAGPAATTGSPIRRSGLLIALILAHGTDTFRPNIALGLDRAHSARFTPPNHYPLTHTFTHYHSVCRQQLPTFDKIGSRWLMSPRSRRR
jgi:hypothetical protein